VSQSLPTPNIHDLFLVVVNDAVGAPGLALLPLVAPMAPEPPDPDGSAPASVTTVIEAATFCAKVAVTETLAKIAGANARQISAVPN
jgi:hypothetical protein